MAAEASKVEEAVAFLMHPDLHNMSVSSKVEFLKNKGLSDEEINMSFSEASLRSKAQDSSYSWSSTLSSLALVGGLIYLGCSGIKSLWSYFNGNSDQEFRAHFDSISQSLESIQLRLSDLEDRLKSMDQQNQSSSQAWNQANRERSDLKSQLDSVRGLLLSKENFPAAPKLLTSSTPQVPSWQLKSSPQLNSELNQGSGSSHQGEGRSSPQGGPLKNGHAESSLSNANHGEESEINEEGGGGPHYD